MNAKRNLRALDERNRISLTGFADSTYYSIKKDGENIILTPVEAVPAYLAAQMRELAGSGVLGK